MAQLAQAGARPLDGESLVVEQVPDPQQELDVTLAVEALLRARVGNDASIQIAEYGERVAMGEVNVSLHPAGHILGSAQVRIERGGEVWVFSGDYKRAPDPTCAPFEPVCCHCFITESTFGLPIYRWAPQDDVFAAIDAWWAENAGNGRASVLFAYALSGAFPGLEGRF